MERTLLWMDFIIEEKNGFWFSSGNYNALFYYDNEKHKVYFMDRFPIQCQNEYRLFSAGIKCEDKLFFAPFHAPSIFYYDIVGKRFYEIPNFQDELRGVPFRKIIKYENDLYFISSAKKAVVVSLNITTLRLELFNYDIPFEISITDFVTRDVIQCENKIFWGLTRKNLIIEFDMKLKSFKINKVPINDMIGTILLYKNIFWISGKQAIYQWAYSTDMIKTISDFPEGYGMSIVQDGEKKFINGFDGNISKWGHPFVKSMIIKEKIVFFAAEMNMSIAISLLDGSLDVFEKEYNEESGRFGPIVSMLRFLFVEKGLEGIYVYSCRDNKMKYMSYQGMEFKSISFQYEKKSIRRLIKNSNRIWGEEEVPLSLSDWIDMIKQKRRNILSICKKSSGQTIYFETKI